ncbi:Hypothetical_protein [Hexamita inflata]|uniref:Hypothetical_protein n=1 Tax=Hexamita inflata TaxID=28002 RepID=A0AA86QMH7_9EUKA|nr:Hypothetical protein HINF_LOCUS50029 [Hexamita inflata]
MSSKWKKELIQLQYQIIRVVDSSPVLRIITILGFISLNIFNIAGRRALRNTSSEFQLLIKIDVEQNLKVTASISNTSVVKLMPPEKLRDSSPLTIQMQYIQFEVEYNLGHTL